MSAARRLAAPLLALAVCAGAAALAPATARASLGRSAGALVLPRAALAAANAASEDHLGWSLTLAPAASALGPGRLTVDLVMPAADQLLNVVGLFGRGMDVGLLAPEDGLRRGQLLFQLRTNLGRPRVVLRCIVRFS